MIALDFLLGLRNKLSNQKVFQARDLKVMVFSVGLSHLFCPSNLTEVIF